MSNSKKVYLGAQKLQSEKFQVEGSIVLIENEKYYKISDSQDMTEFFMTVVSDSDHFMFISSNGSLTAGRKNKNNALFPYYTDDKIQDNKEISGSRTMLLITKEGSYKLWEPFTRSGKDIYSIRRNIYKSIAGNKIIFEELNLDLGLSFSYGWANSEQYGFIKRSKIQNLRNEKVEIEILDGFSNILPSGTDYQFQNEFSNLLDAYKKNELVNKSTIGLFSLSSIPVDRAEPSESLICTTVWSSGLPENKKILLSDHQLESFRLGKQLSTERDIRASRGAYYLNSIIQLTEKETNEWFFVADINQDNSDVANLRLELRHNPNLIDKVLKDVETGTNNLIKIVSSSDGMQLSNEELNSARHFSNTMFNLMRGGGFLDGYKVSRYDLAEYMEKCNLEVFNKHSNWLNNLKPMLDYLELNSLAEKQNDPDLQRICSEYLPLYFSRRHGDPSRPWNYFSIENKNEDGSPKLNYEGNWRDIFQNWEALCLSYPEYIEGMISKFLNASTADGYNPYRISRDGIDWECPNPDEPWAYIGYWGDHQIIYLQKLLEHSFAYHPGILERLLDKEIFVFADVPYEIKDFKNIRKDPRDTIIFNNEKNSELEKKYSRIGADGKLLRSRNGNLIRANLAEKILATLLAKLSNFIPEAGIWLNTQRPEWNDANNALVGSGTSMVTLYYIRRFIKFWNNLLRNSIHTQLSLGKDLLYFLDAIESSLSAHINAIDRGFSNTIRAQMAAELGEAGSTYREKLYSGELSEEKISIDTVKLSNFMELVLRYLDQSIEKNKREDGLYHAYNLISWQENEISIRYLYEMLEGQVSVLSAGYLNAKDSLKVLDTLKASKLFRDDQYSYILYPDRELTRFEDKNIIPPNKIKNSQVLQHLLNKKIRNIVSRDNSGNYHFNSAFRNANLLREELHRISDTYNLNYSEDELTEVETIYEEVFDHQSFTGRSGTFYGYEGLGSIYWHMVSKLLLACQECYFRGLDDGTDAEILNRIKDHYYEIKAGIGLYKNPKLYGAFPTDAYSHTPANSGVKQPGLTGQVKEDIIARFGELGIRVNHGKITLSPSLFNRNELTEKSGKFTYYNLEGKKLTLEVKQDQNAFTYCQVPIILSAGSKTQLLIYYLNGSIDELSGNVIPADLSSEIFSRSGKIQKIKFIFN